MTVGKRLLKLALAGAALAGIAGALALSPQSLPHALADAPKPPPRPAAGYSFPAGINLSTPIQFTPPQLTGLELAPEVSPGGLIKVDGTNLGAQQGAGSLCLLWTSVVVENDFTKQSRLCLDVIDWSDTRVIARVPSDVVGVPDQLADIRVQRDDGIVSNLLGIQFVATRATMTVGSVPVNVQISCSDGSSNDICTAGGGNHSDDFFFSDGSNGTDTYTYHLANGWKFYSMDFSLVDGSATESGTPRYGDADFSLRVDWDFGGFTTRAIYNFNIVAIGPVGVPMQ